MIHRDASGLLLKLAKQYPVVLITGPRQAGKTTLAKVIFPNHRYVSLENLDTAEYAREDPRGFLATYDSNVIFDEIQRVPSILSYLQQLVDEAPIAGSYILTGSQHFGLMASAVQSLAGRVGRLELLPFSTCELIEHNPELVKDSNTCLRRGFYPPVIDRNLDAELWYENYTATYLERDVRQIENIRELSSFRRFLSLCAGRTAQLLNLSEFAGECGVSHNTIKAWVSVLEESYLIALVQPYHVNFNKRIVKTPKLYFLDTGLAARLLGIRSDDQLASHPLRGALFETYVFGELAKLRNQAGKPWEIYFWRDHGGVEVDFILEHGTSISAVEVKSGATFHSDFIKGLERFESFAGDQLKRKMLVFAGSDSFIIKNCRVLRWDTFSKELASAMDS